MFPEWEFHTGKPVLKAITVNMPFHLNLPCNPHLKSLICITVSLNYVIMFRCAVFINFVAAEWTHVV